MKKRNHIFLLFTIIIIEGYVVLSTELLAIRQTIPFVGNGTDTVSIIIAAVLMPLAFGYYAGGQYRPGLRKNGRYSSVRRKLVFNIMVSMLILLLGMSYALLTVFFFKLTGLGLNNRAVLTTLYALLFLVTPVYLLGQTVPLVSNYFSKKQLSQITGRMLFFSTVGSFLGAVFSTLVLMATIGVHYTAALNFILLALLVVLLSRKKTSEAALVACAIAVGAVSLNSGKIMDLFHIVENNQYNTIAVYEDENGDRHLALNNNDSSKYNDDGTKHEYIQFIERATLPFFIETPPPKNILVIGAGGFTFGFEDKVNHYDYVDVDKSLKEISEEHILKEKLSDNKTFHPVPARGFLSSTDKKYDLILLDTYFGDTTFPEHLMTLEFFEQVKAHLNEDGVVFANFIISPSFASRISRHVDNTFRKVFSHVSRHVIREEYNLWDDKNYKNGNVIYIYRHRPEANTRHIYTDNKNTIFYDKPQRR